MGEADSQNNKEIISDRKLPCQVTFFLGDDAFNGASMHFNERGILITCKEPAPLNAKVRMLLMFPGLKNTMELTGEVVWTNIYGPGDSLAPKGMGVKFTNVEREVERLLADLSGQYDACGSIYSCYFT